MAAKKAGAQAAGVSREEFDTLANSVGELVGLIKSGALSAPAQTPAQVTEQKEIEKAVENKYTVNPEWEEMAREIINAAVPEAFDHTELQYAKGGGLVFTICIKTDKSNAARDYLERYKVDRRSREIGAEGEAGAKEWAIRVATNLKRPRSFA